MREGWSLQQRVNRSIIGVLLLLMFLIAVVVTSLLAVKRTGDQVVDRWNPARLSSQEAIGAMLNQETGVRGFATSLDESFLQPYTDNLQVERDDEQDLGRDLGGDEELLDLLHDFHLAVAAWQTNVAEPYIGRAQEGDPTVGRDAASPDAKAAFDRIRVAAAALDTKLTARTDQAKEARDRAFLYVWVTVGVGTCLLLGVGLVLGRGLRRSVLAPMTGLAHATRQVAAGDLEREITPSGPQEIVELGIDVDLMRARLADQILRIERARLHLQQRSAELARSNADLEQFAYVASHDLSEPLRKVTNFGQLLERQYADQLDDKARQYIAFMVDGAKRMQVLINDLLSFSRVGRTTDHFVPVDLDQTLDRVLSTLDDTIQEAGIEVRRSGPLPTVPGDRTLLTALLQNLIGNSVKYRSPDRPLVIEIGSTKEGDRWRITVADNGIGVDPQYADRIFTIFQRLHVRDAYGGTGIGLALCRKIVQFHRGRIWLANRAESEGPGATFQFTLPERQAPMETVDDDEP